MLQRMAQGKEHWQVDKTLQQCNQHLLENPHHFSDVTFRVHCKQHSRYGMGPIGMARIYCEHLCYMVYSSQTIDYILQ
jgi:hypothetical protein